MDNREQPIPLDGTQLDRVHGGSPEVGSYFECMKRASENYQLRQQHGDREDPAEALQREILTYCDPPDEKWKLTPLRVLPPKFVPSTRSVTNGTPANRLGRI